MKKIWMAILLALPAMAQREFLTNNEIEQIREEQEPNARLKIYVLFARQRLDQLQQQIAKDKKGRSLEIRNLLGEYAQIIDAIDTVSEDALKRKVNIALGTQAVAEAEKKFVVQLEKIQSSRPHDLDMYEVDLKDALGSTTDSLASTAEDLALRSQSVAAKVEREKKEIEEVTTPQRAKEQKAEAAKVDLGDDGKPKRKPPTLYRPGEKQTPP